MSYRIKLRNYLVTRDRAWILLLLAAICIVYLPFLGSPLFFDDLPFFGGGAVAAYADKGFDLSLRWFPYVSLGWTYALFSDEYTHAYHLGNMLLHVANTLLLFFFLRQLIGAVQAEDIDAAVVTRGAWFGALIFALHPVAVFAVGYVIQRSILMATLFALLMQLAYLRGLLSGRKRWFALAVTAYFLACFSKEHSVLMPLVLGAMGLLVHGAQRAERKVLWSTWMAFLAIAVLVTLRARGVLGSPYEAMAAQLFEQQGIAESTPMLHLLSALTQAGLFFKYLFLWLLPEPSMMAVDMRETFIASISVWQGWLGGVAFVLYGAFAARLLLRGGMSGLAGFALLYPWLLFWVEMAGIRVQEPFVLYRSYLWMPGLLLLLPLLLVKFPQRRTLLVLGCIALLLIPLAWKRLWVFSDNYRLWNEAALLLKSERMAGADRIFYNRGQAELALKKWEDAAVDFERALTISPQLVPVRYVLGVAYGNSGRYAEALGQFDIVIGSKPNDAQVYFAKGMTLKRMGRDDEARQQMKRACELKNQIACLLASGFGAPALKTPSR
ncbi:MAG TPA: tetratricopeptide repeat protein [Sideroxyarcus sp.]|nr:tetratricopeptide repeat protein [Sideroxyarcus sp.]